MINLFSFRQNSIWTATTSAEVSHKCFYCNAIYLVGLLFTPFPINLVVARSELLARHALQPRDIRFSAASSLYIRGTSIILKLQVIIRSCMIKLYYQNQSNDMEWNFRIKVVFPWYRVEGLGALEFSTTSFFQPSSIVDSATYSTLFYSPLSLVVLRFHFCGPLELGDSWFPVTIILCLFFNSRLSLVPIKVFCTGWIFWKLDFTLKLGWRYN